MAALAGKEVDRIPGTIWKHFSHLDRDPISLAKAQVEFVKRFDFDFIKLMPFGMYAVQDWGVSVSFSTDPYSLPGVCDRAIHNSEDWLGLSVLNPEYGALGQQLQLARNVGKLSKGEIPFVQTIFSPLTTAMKLSGNLVFEHMNSEPEKLKAALEVITETTIRFVDANIAAGVDGFFFATQIASKKMLSLPQYIEFVEEYDLRILKHIENKTAINILHIHGSDIMFERLKDYPVNCLNWHDRDTFPDFGQARKMTDKCFLGGINEIPLPINHEFIHKSVLAHCRPEEVFNHVREAIESNGSSRGVIIGPGCISNPHAIDQNYEAVRKALEIK